MELVGLVLVALVAQGEGALYYQRVVTAEELAERTVDELALMRNTILARAGQVFRKAMFRDHFARQAWYRPTGFDATKLTEIDRLNLDMITRAEARGPYLPIAVPCAGDPGRWSAVRVPAERAALLVAAGSLTFREVTHQPLSCGLKVETRCAPDLDGDGAAETLVRFSWVIGFSDGASMSCAALLKAEQWFWPAQSVVAMSRQGRRWRALAPLTFVMSGDQYCIYDWQIRGFLRGRHGRVVVEGSQCWAGECSESEDSCDPWRATLRGDRVVEVGP